MNQAYHDEYNVVYNRIVHNILKLLDKYKYKKFPLDLQERVLDIRNDMMEDLANSMDDDFNQESFPSQDGCEEATNDCLCFITGCHSSEVYDKIKNLLK